MGCFNSRNIKSIQTISSPISLWTVDEPDIDEDGPDIYAFTVTIANLRVRGPKEGTPWFLKIIWGRTPQVFQTEVSTTLKWTDKWEFGYRSSLRHLEQETAQIILFSAKSSKPKPECTTSLQLLDLAVGPVHQDFCMKTNQAVTYGRLGFDVEMRQNSPLRLVPYRVLVNLDEDYSGYEFTLSMKTRGSFTVESVHSDPCIYPPQWVFSEDEFIPEAIPTIEMTVSFESMLNESLQLLVWRHNKKGFKIHGECWLGFAKLFQQERINIFQRESSIYGLNRRRSTSGDNELQLFAKQKESDHNKHFKETLWLKGKCQGMISGQIQITNTPIFHQMVCGVNSEDGFQPQAVKIFEDPSQNKLFNPKASLPAEAFKLIELKKYLDEFLYNRSRHIATTAMAKQQENAEHTRIIHEIVGLLKSTHRSSLIQFEYKSQNDLMRSQGLLLEVAEFFINFVDVITYEVRHLYFDCLVAILKRGELDLGNLSLDNVEPGLLLKKKEIAVRYKSFLKYTLKYVLRKLNFKGGSDNLRRFIEYFMAMAFYRIPLFQKQYLTCLKQKSYGPIDEWRSAEWNINTEDDDLETGPVLASLDWPAFFWSFLDDDKKEWEDVLSDNTWQERISKRGVAYFRVAIKWVRHVKSKFVRKDVPWRDIPGYRVIVKTTLLEMKERSIILYPDALIDLSANLVVNTYLLPSFMNVLFRKTNIYNTESVSISFKILDTWFTSIHDSGQALKQAALEWRLFVEALRISLSSDICMNVISVLLFLYKNYHLLQGERRDTIFLQLIDSENLFFSLFCHWNFYVRNVFHSLILYRILGLTEFDGLEQQHIIHDSRDVNEQVHEAYTERIEKIWNMIQSGTTESDFPQIAAPYVQIAWDQYRNLRDGSYREWAGRVAKINTENESIYPEIKLVSMHDRGEKMIEEW